MKCNRAIYALDSDIQRLEKVRSEMDAANLDSSRADLEHTSNFRPLGEPKELKTKFDSIFEVERYVKVMDSIKKNAKELVRFNSLKYSVFCYLGSRLEAHSSRGALFGERAN